MGIFNFGHRPKPKTFNFIPRHYDEEKEKRALRKEMSKEENRDNPDFMKKRIRAGLSAKKPAPGEKRKAIARSNMRLLITIALVCLISYLLIVKYFPLLDQFLQ